MSGTTTKTKKKTATKKAPAKKRTTRKRASSKPKGMVQITSPVRPDVQFYVASELADDQLIEQQITGEILPTMIYEFCPKKCKDLSKCSHRKTQGLSKNGVDEVVRRLNRNPASGSKIRISPEPPMVEHNVDLNGQKGVQVMVYAEDLVSGNGAWGTKFEPYSQYGGTNQFAFEKALSKAQRNAKRSLVPEQLATSIIAKLIKQKGAVQQIAAPANIVVEVEPQETNADKLYGAALKRVQQIKNDKAKLEAALGKVDAMGLSPEHTKQVKMRIQDALKEL